MRGVVTMVVVGALLLAGCGGFAAQSQQQTEEPVTPVPVPSVTPTASADAPPGVSADHVDAALVAARHERALTDVSHTVTTRVRWEGANGTHFEGGTVVRADPGPDRYVLSEQYARPRGFSNRTGFDAWHDGEHVVVRTTFAEGPPEYDVYRNQTIIPVVTRSVLDALVSRLSVERISHRDDGSTVVQGSLQSTTSLHHPKGMGNPTNGSLSARLHPDGYVERLAVGYDAEFNGSTARVREEMSVTNVGETTVTEPSWVAHATE